MEAFLKRFLLFRPSRVPSAGIPLGARSVGHYRMNRSSDKPMIKHFFQFFWTISGRGCFRLGREKHGVSSGEIYFYRPGDEHFFFAKEAPWEFRWWTMDGKGAEQIVANFGFENQKPRYVGLCPHELFLKLEHEIGDGSLLMERRASATAYALLAEAAKEGTKMKNKDPKSEVVSQCTQIIQKNFTDPNLGVSQIANQLKMDRTTLSKLFKHQTGLSPVEYLNRIRIQEALSQLRHSSLPIAEVAQKTGFRTPNYFARVVKKTTSESPRSFRSS